MSNSFPDYDITADETITVTIPASALTAATEITATPTFVITAGGVSTLLPIIMNYNQKMRS